MQHRVNLLRTLARIGKQRDKMIWQTEEQQGREKDCLFQCRETNFVYKLRKTHKERETRCNEKEHK